MLRHQFSMLAQPITCLIDPNNDGVMEQTIEKCCCRNVVAKNIAPFGKATVGG